MILLLVGALAEELRLPVVRGIPFVRVGPAQLLVSFFDQYYCRPQAQHQAVAALLPPRACKSNSRIKGLLKVTNNNHQNAVVVRNSRSSVTIYIDQPRATQFPKNFSSLQLDQNWVSPAGWLISEVSSRVVATKQDFEMVLREFVSCRKSRINGNNRLQCKQKQSLRIQGLSPLGEIHPDTLFSECSYHWDGYWCTSIVEEGSRRIMGLLALSNYIEVDLRSKRVKLGKAEPLPPQQLHWQSALGLLPLALVLAAFCVVRQNPTQLYEKYEAVIINQAQFSTDRSADSGADDQFFDFEDESVSGDSVGVNSFKRES